MASGGSSGRPGSCSRSFDFGYDDVLCSYEDYTAQDPPIAKRAELKDLRESAVSRPLVSIYEQDDYSNDSMMSTVEKCMKKYADNVLRSLEGISGRLSQLELHCYKLERSLGEFRTDFNQDLGDNDMKFKSLEKHIQEVHRSVQILRDKQELAETQKELAKLQLLQKESLEKNESAVPRKVLESTKLDDKPEAPNLQLALALPRQVTPIPTGASQAIPHYKELSVLQQVPATPNIQQNPSATNLPSKYYTHHQSLPQDQRSQPVQSELHYVQQRSQLQDIPVQAPPQQPMLVNQSQPQPFLQYQPQLPPQPNQQLTQQVVQPQQPTSSQAQIRPEALQSYPPFPPLPMNPVPETFAGSMPMQVPNPTIPQPVGIRPEVLTSGYGGAVSTVSRPPLHQNIQLTLQRPVGQNTFGPQLSKSNFVGNATYLPQQYGIQGYSPAYGYPQNNPPSARNQQVPPSNGAAVHRDSQMLRNHPFEGLIEKAVNMGYVRSQVISCLQKMVESGQPMDFNTLLDRLNGPTGGASARAW